MARQSLSIFFDYPQEIRRLVCATNTLKGYNRQLRKLLKTKAAVPSPEAARKLLYLVNRDITKKWTAPIRD